MIFDQLREMGKGDSLFRLKTGRTMSLANLGEREATGWQESAERFLEGVEEVTA